MEEDLVVFVDRRLLLSRRRRRITAVEEAVAVPRHARHLDPLERVIERRLAGQVHDLELLPVRAAARDAVDRVRRVLRWREDAQADRAIGRPRVRIDQHFRCAVDTALDEENALVLQSRVPAEEEVRSLARRCRVLFVVVQLQHARLERGAKRDAFEIRERDGVLRLAPTPPFRLRCRPRASDRDPGTRCRGRCRRDRFFGSSMDGGGRRSPGRQEPLTAEVAGSPSPSWFSANSAFSAVKGSWTPA